MKPEDEGNSETATTEAANPQRIEETGGSAKLKQKPPNRTKTSEKSPMVFERCRLKTAKDVRTFQARIIRLGVKGEMKSGEVYKYVMAASMLLKSIGVSDLEERIEALEGNK